jgi:NitT/TauT family transport system ATP-binding protein
MSVPLSPDSGGAPLLPNSRTAAPCAEGGPDGPAGGAAVRFQGIGMRFPGGVEALTGIDLDLPVSRITTVLGVSGCGKSTLLRLAAGLALPTAGRIDVLGKTPAIARGDRDFGIVFQDAALFPWRTVRQNIRLPGELFHSREILGRVDDWIRRVGLAGFEDALPAQLSGGMRSRVAIARALVFRPRILMMDEPFGALDELTRGEMQRELLTLVAEYHPTVLFITHSVTEALYLADQVVVMTPRPGRIRAVVDVPFQHPRDPHLRHAPEFARLSDELFTLLTGG